MDKVLIEIEDIENIIIESKDEYLNSKYKVIYENEEWKFLDLKTKRKYGGYSKESAYNMIKNYKIISVPDKIYELWT